MPTDKCPITAIILAKNAALTIEPTLKSLEFCETILVLNDGSNDFTEDISRKYTTSIYYVENMDFAEKRNYGLKLVKTDWVFYIDADEVVSKDLKNRIITIVAANNPSAFSIKRENYFLGKKMYPDFVDRLFHVSTIKGWYGRVHESPILNSLSIKITESLIHHTHLNIFSMLHKTNNWSEYEAQLRIEAQHPSIAWWRLVRIAVTTFISNYVGKRLYTFGRPGLFESYFQMIDKLIVYTKLWEKQQKLR